MEVGNCIGRRLKEARLSFGISQRGLGILAGIDEHAASARMNQYETGKHIPNVATLRHIGKVLGYPLEFFFSEDDLTAEIIYLLEKLSDAHKKEILDVVKTLALQYDKNTSLV